MPAVSSKTFQIPLFREPKKNDIILVATKSGKLDTSCVASMYNGSSWTAPSNDQQYINKPSYANGFIGFSISYTTIIPLKATYVTGWEDS